MTQNCPFGTEAPTRIQTLHDLQRWCALVSPMYWDKKYFLTPLNTTVEMDYSGIALPTICQFHSCIIYSFDIYTG